MGLWWEKLVKRNHLKDLGIDRMINSDKLNKNKISEHRLDSSIKDKHQVVDSCEYGNETLGSIECREFLDQLRNY
jgi:hypothetical protein